MSVQACTRIASRTVNLRGHGVSLSADVAGPESGPPVVLLHGGGQTRRAWSSAVRALAADGHRVLSLDLRGHGDSGWADDGDYRLDALVADLEAVIATLPTPPVLVGASLGGITSMLTIAAAVEAGRPAPARALVLVDVAPRIEKAGGDQIRAFLMKHLDGFASVDEAAQAVAAYNPRRNKNRADSGTNGAGAGLMKSLRAGPDGRLYWHWDPRFIDAIPSEVVEQTNERLARAAAHIPVPVLLVWGRQSNIVSPESVADLKARIAHAEVADIADAGHMLVGDQNDAFNETVLAYLRRLPEPGPRP